MTTNIGNVEYEALLDRFKRALRAGGLKYTKQREVLLKTLYNNAEHFSPEDLYKKIDSEYPNLKLGIATVYRTLNMLEQAGMVSSISFGSQGKKYELITRAHHDHIICKNCGKVIAEFEDPVIEKRQLAIAKEYGVELKGHVMQPYGICAECQQKEAK